MDELPKTDLNKLILRRIETLGVIHSHLYELMRLDIFDDLSKHSPFWHHEDVLSEEEKLDSIRRQISCLHDDLSEIIDIIERE